MILGRNPALWLALVAAIVNVAVVVFNLNLTADQIVALNALAFAVVGILANSSDPTTVGTFALTTRAPAQRLK
jgi:uncharacterized membrane protein